MAKAEREMLNIKGRKASSNTSRLHVLFLLSSGCICDERIFHKIYLTRSEIISALLLGGCFSTLNVVCNPKNLLPTLNVPTSKFDFFWKKQRRRGKSIEKGKFWIRGRRVCICWWDCRHCWEFLDNWNILKQLEKIQSIHSSCKNSVKTA
jgi:hypothetical protein